MQDKYLIFGSGDSGTRELCDIFTDLALPYTFIDIRQPAKRGQHDPLKFLADHRLHTVPQVFQPNGALIGNFQATVTYLDSRIEVIDP
jgi:hypothetical protein